jgi:hypothetical protein
MTDGNAEQTRIIAEKIAQQMMDIYGPPPRHPEPPLPPFVRWFSIAVGGFGSAALIGLGFWLVTSVSSMSNTLARMDERQIASSASLADRFEKIDERLNRLEGQQEAKR